MPGLTRDEMAKIIDRGESFFFKGKDNGLRIISTHKDIPSEAELAQASKDPATIVAEMEAREKSLAVEQAKLRADRDAFNKAQADAEAKKKSEEEAAKPKPAPKPEAK